MKSTVTIANTTHPQWVELTIDGVYMARIWGVPKVAPPTQERPTYHVTVKDHIITGFFHPDEIAYQDERR